MATKAKTNGAEVGYLDVDALLGQVLPEEDHEIPGVGTVRIRGLTREHALKVAQMANKDAGFDVQEREWLRWGLVSPEMTYQQIEAWQQRAPSATIGTLTDAIVRLSGMEEGADKEAYKSVPGRSES